MQTKLDALAYEFFREFARCEYCLKAVGLLVLRGREPKADWGSFAEEIRHVLEEPSNRAVNDAVQFYLEQPPKKQVFADGGLDWDEVPPDHRSKAELVLRLLCRVRNNLFHGGKFNGHWFEPQRSEELLEHGLVILRTCIATHPLVKKAYDDKAF